MKASIAVAAAILALTVATAPMWWPGDTGRPAAGTSSRQGDAVVVEARPARRVGAVAPEPPRSLRLPTGVVVPVGSVSTRPDGLLRVPGDIDRAGWWRGGSSLGDPLGSTLIAAHVDSTTQGLGPFVALLSVRPEQRFVLSSRTLRQVFRTTSLRLLPQGSLRRHPGLYAASGQRRLVLVTCAPPYLPDRGGYQNLAVVTAVPVSAPTHRRDR